MNWRLILYNIKTTAIISITFAILLSFVLLINAFSTYQHETAHQTIYASYGVSSTIEMNYFGGTSYTIPNQTEVRELCDDYCKLSQNMVESNYEFAPLLTGIMIFQVIIILILLFKQQTLFVEVTNENLSENL